jgi:hypothetical protein
MTSSLDVKISIWTLLHDWTGGGMFEYMGLIDASGNKKNLVVPGKTMLLKNINPKLTSFYCFCIEEIQK